MREHIQGEQENTKKPETANCVNFKSKCVKCHKNINTPTHTKQFVILLLFSQKIKIVIFNFLLEQNIKITKQNYNFLVFFHTDVLMHQACCKQIIAYFHMTASYKTRRLLQKMSSRKIDVQETVVQQQPESNCKGPFGNQKNTNNSLDNVTYRKSFRRTEVELNQM